MNKGIMFSFIMVFLTITLITLIALQASLVSHRREELAVETRINSMNNLYESIIRDIKKSLSIIARRAMSVAFMNVSSRGYGLDEANETLAELILNGTLEGSFMTLMENATFLEWVDKIEHVSEMKGFNTTITLQSLEIKPYDSFNLEIDTRMYINITDLQGVAKLNKYTTVVTIVDIEELEDPLYPLSTNGLGTNTIKISPFIGNYTQLLLTGTGGNSYIYGETTNDTGNFDNKILVVHNASEISGLSNAKGVISEEEIVIPITIPYVVNSTALNLIPNGINVLLDGDNGKIWFIDNLIEDTENSYYHPSETGPSYLDRLEGRLYIHSKYLEQQPGKVIGLESFVNKNALWFAGVSPIYEEKTNVDYIYFSGSSPTANKIKGLDETFRIDNEDNHQEIYNVNELLIS